MMTSDFQHSLLLVEDDDFAAEITTSQLLPDYIVHRVENGQAALDFVAQQKPDLVLLDILMPGLSGFEVCRQLRDDQALSDLPIIFLSGMVDEKERLAGYEAGGNDFLSKPVVGAELRHKVDQALQYHCERQRLNNDLASTFATAMSAMSTTAETGVLVNFLRASFNCQDYADLCQEVLNALAAYGLEGNVQIRGAQGILSLGSGGRCSPLEESVLNNLFGHSRLFEFSSCLSCSYPHITVIIKNMERDDAGRNGRIRDNVAILTEGADVRINALDKDYELEKKQATQRRLIANTSQALRAIEQQHREQLHQSDGIFQDLQLTLEQRMITLGLTEEQENELVKMIQDAAYRALALYDEGLSIESHMEKILMQLDKVG